MNSHKLFIIMLFIVFFYPFVSSAQEDSTGRQRFGLELGGGLSIVSEGMGFNGRLAFTYLSQKWGGVFRITAHDGGNGVESNSFFLGSHSPKEKFFEEAVLISKIIKKTPPYNIIASVGLGSFWGERLTPRKTGLDTLERVIGFAYELGVKSSQSTIGFSFLLTGNLNSEVSQFGIVLSITI